MPATVDLDALAKKYGGVSEEPKVAPAKVDYDSLAKKFGGQAAAPTVDHDALAQKHGGTPVEQPKLPFWQRAVSDEGAGKAIGVAAKARQGTLDLFSNIWHHGSRPLALSDQKYAEYQKQLHDSWEHIAKLAKPLVKVAMLSAPEVHGVTGEQAEKVAQKTVEPIAGFGAGGEEFAESMLTSPTQAALMVGTWGGSALEQGAIKAGYPLAARAVGTVSKLVSLQFAAQMTEGAVQGAENTYRSAVNGDWYEAGKSASEALTSGLMARGIIDHAAAEARVQGDLNKVAQEQHGKRFNDLNPYDQGLVIDETVKRSPEYQDILKSVEAKDEEAKAQIKEKRQKKLENYYGSALEQAWEPNAAKRAIHGLTQAEYVGEEARQKKIKDVVETIKAKAEARRAEAIAERPEKRQSAAGERVVRGKAAEELRTQREELYAKRQQATEKEPEVEQRHVEAIRDDEGNVRYPATYWGEENSFGVASDLAGHAVYRQTPRGVEWLDSNGNFSETPEQLFNSTDPETADTVARLSSLKIAAESEDKNPQEADLLADIHRQLVTGEIDAKTAQRQAGIAEKVTLPDEFNAAREGRLNGPFHDSSAAKYLSQLEEEANGSGVSEEDTAELLKNAGLVARQQTEQNLHHVYQPGDYITARSGVRWTLDSKGMLHPDDGGQPVPLMKRGFYSNQAVQLAESGQVGYGTRTRAERRMDAVRRREVADALASKQEEVAREMRLAQQQEGLQTTPENAPRADVEEKQTHEERRATMPRREHEAEPRIQQLVNLIFKAPTEAGSAIQTIAKDKGVSPEEVMRIQLATYPAVSGSPEQKIAGLEVGDKLVEPVRKTPWVVEQGKDGLYLRSGNAQPLKLDRLNPSQFVKSLVERAKLEKANAEGLEQIAGGKPAYARYQEDQLRAVQDRAQEKEPEPKTEKQAAKQAQSAERRTRAVESVATKAAVEAIDPQTTNEAEAAGKAEEAEKHIKVAEEAYKQEVEAKSKTEPEGEGFQQRAPITIGLRGNQGTIVQNQKNVPFHFELVPIEALTTSHEWHGTTLIPNPTYPEALQPRTISEGESKQNALRADEKNYDWRQYADKTINGSMGPAIVDAGGQVVGGNTRIAILRKHLENLDAISDPERKDIAKAGMRMAMERLAKDSGISRVPDDGKFYVVVRMLDEPIRDTRQAAELGRLFNKHIGVEITKSARGVSYAKSFDEPVLADIGRRVESNDGIVAAMKADPEFFRDLVINRFGVTPEEYANWFEDVPGRGQILHEEGRNQFVKALLGTVIKDTSILNRLEGKTPYRALERALGYIVKMKALPDRDISEKIVEAMTASAETMGTDPALSRTKDKWAATYNPDQQELMGMETDNPPEPDRITEALWRALHASDAATPRIFNDRLKSFIGEETSKGGWLIESQVETPAEAFNRAFKAELREVQHSRGDREAGVTQEEFDAALKGRELSDQEREEAEDRADGRTNPPAAAVEPKVPAEASQTVERQAEPAEKSKFGLTPPPRVDTEKAATERLAAQKQEQGYVTPAQLSEFLKSHPGTKNEASELMRTATLMAEYVYDADPPVGVDRKDALDWVLRERLARIELGENKAKRGEYSDPEIEKNFGTKILKLHEAADPTTFIHEFAHVIFPLLSDEDLKAIDTIGGHRAWEGPPKGARYAEISEKLAHGLEQFLRDENPTGFTADVKQVLAKVKAIMRKVYLSFASDPLSKFKNTDESREVFAKMFGITGFDKADEFQKDLRLAKAEAKRIKSPKEAPHPLEVLRKEMGANGIIESMAGKVEDTAGERVDPRKPVAMLKYDKDMDAVSAFLNKVGKEGSKIQDAELIRGEDGTWGIRFNTDEKLPPDVLNQELPEKHPGIQLEELEKQLRETKSYQTLQRQLLELKISNLNNRIRAEYGTEELKPQTNPELVDKALEESRRGRETANGVRKESHGIPGIQKPQGVGRISKPSFLGMPGHAGSAERGGAKGSAVARVPASLSEVKPVALEPIVKPRGTPVGTVTGEAFDPKGWVESLKRSGLPENAPAPTYALDPKTAAVLKFPGQKQVVQLAMSALEQGDGVVIATATGSGKTFTAMATVKEFLRQNPDAMVLHITKNRGLLKDAQKIAENSFGIGLETEAPQPGKAGVYGVSYVGLLNDKTYQNIPWDLVVADESGEARNWHTPDNQQGKMLKKVVENSRKAVYLSATPFHSPNEYGYLDKLNLWPKGGFDKWIEQNFAHEKIGDRVVARLDPAKQAKLRQQLIERGQLVSQAISYDGYTAHFGVVPVTDQMKRGLDRIHEGFARARSQFIRMGKKGMSEKAAAFEATYTKAFLERERIPQAIELAKQARDKGWQVMVFSETSSEDLFRRERTPGVDPSTYQELDDAMGGQLSKIIPPFENVYDRLKEKFGDEIGDYSGRGNTQASRDQAKQEFMTGKTPMLYSTYAAGGIGVSLHDADFPELNVKGGDKPRVAIFLGPPYSGVLLEQAMGRSWRFGVKSDVHAVFLATDSEPDVRLMQTKVGPRMRALRAAVLGEKDSLASAMSDYTDEQKVRARQDALAYAEGDEVKVNAGSYQVRSKSRDVGINNWSEINFPHSDAAKNKGMKYGETILGGDWTTLYQSKFGPFEPPPSPEDEAGKKIINEIGNAAVSGKIPGLKDVDPADRQAVTGLSSANATAEVELPVDRDKKATARQSMESNLRNSSFIPYQGFYMSQELGIQNICRMAGKPEVGLELTRMERSEQAERNVYQAEYWNQLDDVLRQQGLYPSGFMSEGRRMKHLDDVIREMSYVMEGKKVSDNPAINRAAADMSDMMRIAHSDMAKDGVRVTTHDGEKIPYSSFGEDPKYWPRRIDWDHELPDPRDPSKTIKLRDLLKPKFDEEARKRAIEAIPELRPYSTKQVMDYLFRNDPRAPLLTNVHHAREMNFPFYKRDYRTLVGYFDQVAKARSEARNFGWDEGKLNKEIEKITNPNGQATIKSMFRSLLHPQSWQDWSAKVYSFGMAYEAASKMTFSAFKLPGHLLLPPLAMDGRVMPIMKAMKNLALHPREVSENAAYVGTISRQLSAADAMYGEHGSPAVRGILKKEMFEAVYKLDRIITGESAKVYMEQYAMRDLQKGGTRAEHTRRILRDRFLVGDHAIDEAIARGRFSQEDLAKGQTAFANLTTFSDNPMQMPAMARMEINRFDTPWDKTTKRAIRLTYALKSFGIKATSLLRETMYDEMVVHHNFRMLPYVMVASPIVGEMILLMGQGAKHVAAKGMAGLQGKQAQEDSWDKHLKRLEDLGEHPDAVKATKELIDTVSMGYGLEMMSMMGKPLYDIAVGAPEKSDQYWLPDALETLAGPFFADIYRTADEVSTLQKIHAGQKHPEQKPKKYERSIMQYAAGQVPALRNVPQVAEEIASKKKNKGFIYAPPGKE